MGDATTTFGLVTSEEKFYPFDKIGNSKTREALQTASRTGERNASVAGALDGDTIKVNTIQIQ